MSAFADLSVSFAPQVFTDGLVVAVSGGLDSSVLLDLLAHRAKKIAHPRLVVAHVNYGLRSEADADAEFVATRAAHYGVPCEMLRADPAPDGANIQQWARAIRYAFFHRVAQGYDCHAVVVAHHADDQAETVLWRLLRGTGLDGLSGMNAARALGDDRHVLRPLLGTTRAQLAAYAEHYQIPYREDQSNRSDQYTRNRIRHELLPYCERLQPGATRHLALTVHRLQRDAAYLTRAGREAWNVLEKEVSPHGVQWNRRQFVALDPAMQIRVLQRAYYQLLPEAGAVLENHLTTMQQIAAGEDGAYHLPGACLFECKGPYCVLRKSL